MTYYYYAPGMVDPYWGFYEDRGTRFAHNLSADTDMSDLDEEGFHQFFPHAFEISAEQVGNIDPAEGIAWAMFLEAANAQH